MKIFLTGATGFVGRNMIRQLLSAGHQVRALVRKEPHIADVETRIGDVTEPTTLKDALSGCDAVIHLVGIIRENPSRGVTFARLHTEATQNMVQAATDQGVGRYLQMSANGTRKNASTPYHQTKWAAEQAVQSSALDWTIFRPSLIFGPRDQFVNTLAGLIRTLPVVPVMGDGRYRMQPVAVEDVCRGFVNALTRPETIGKTFHCGGPQDYSYNEILDIIGEALGKKRVCKLHHPLSVMKPAVALLQTIPWFPLTSVQLQMLLEGNCCDPADWLAGCGLEELTDFKTGIRAYL